MKTNHALIIALLVAPLPGLRAAPPTPAKPNIVIILAKGTQGTKLNLASEAGGIRKKFTTAKADAKAVGHVTNGKWHDDNAIAICSGQWKVIESTKGRDGKVHQLYDLTKDPGETTDVAQEHPEIVKQLAAGLEKARSDGRTRK